MQDSELKHLLSSTPVPKPDAQAKERAIQSALTAFDEKNYVSPQGTGFVARLIQWIHDHTQPRETIMKTPYAIAGGLALATLTIALLNTSYLSDVMPVPKPHASVTAVPVSSPPSETEMALGLDPAKDDSAQKSEIAKADSDRSLHVAETSPPALPAPVKSAPMESVASAVAPEGNMQESKASRSASIAAPSQIMKEVADSIQPPAYHDEGRDRFEKIDANPVKIVKEEAVSTFSIDVDTSSYSFVRASLNGNALPQKDAVRVEEMINYFPYDYAGPKDKSEPFKANVAVFPTPWNKNTKLLHIGIKGYQLEQASKPHANLVFLLDTSGSMNEPNKLPLLQNSMKLLLTSLQPNDTVAIVTYAGSAGTVLEPTQAKDKAKILSALDHLSAGGSTAGAEGIRQAYQLAEQHFDKQGINRVILATDGDFNVGITNPEELKSFVERKRETGVYLSVLGFGNGNYNDAMMQTLAQNGNGNAAYIDTLSEARKVLVEEAGSTLFPIAKDVKIQVEFNPATVAEYRLVGYETRLLKREDFNNDKVDAGEIGAGHTVTAIYEITPVGNAVSSDPLRYQTTKTEIKPIVSSDEYAFVKIRYKLPNASESVLVTTPVGKTTEAGDIANVSTEARFATAVAAFGQLLRGDSHLGTYGYDDAIALAQSAKGIDAFGYRAESINLMRLAKTTAALQSSLPPVKPELIDH